MVEGGKRTRGLAFTSSKERPIVSVITIVYNRKKDLQATFRSVFEQSYDNIEYIVVDGGSSDGTLELIQENDDKIGYWRSEPDKGLYDAMNKGLSLAKGDYLWFMNAGDLIYDKDTVKNLVSKAGREADIYFGETLLFDEDGKEWGLRSEVTTQKLPKDLSWRSLKLGMVVCHQSILVKRDLAPEYILDHPYSADIDWVIKSLKNAKRIVNTDQILSRYLMGGFSKKNLIKSWNDRYKILARHYGFLPNLWNHMVIILRAIFRSKKY